MAGQWIEVDYRFPERVDVAKQAQVIAIGQTAGTWDATWEHRSPAFRQHMAEVVAVEGRQATVRFPLHNIEPDIGSLLTMIFGKYSLAGPAKITAVRLPSGFGTPPKFGAAGIRQLLGVQERPLVMAIFKPALGLSADDHAAILRQVANARLDIIKDDEILGNNASAPTLERLAACRAVLDEVKAATGRTVLYAVNVTGRADVLLERARELVRAGANALLLNVFAYGISVLEALAADAEVNVPIFAHPAFAGAMAGSPDYGVAYGVLLGTLLAHAGADAVLYPAHYGNLPFDKAEETTIKTALRERGVLPVPSAGIHPGVVPLALRDYGVDVALNAGTGIMDHPDGPAAGVEAFFEALRIAVPGVPFTVADVPAGPLQNALKKWGNGA